MLGLSPENVVNSSTMRKDWSHHIDKAVYEKPVFISRRDKELILCSSKMLQELTKDLHFVADQYIEEDNSITLSLVDIDLAVNEDTIELAKRALANDLIEYAKEYYEEYDLYSRAPNRKNHLPFIIKVFAADSIEELEDSIVCQPGKM